MKELMDEVHDSIETADAEEILAFAQRQRALSEALAHEKTPLSPMEAELFQGLLESCQGLIGRLTGELEKSRIALDASATKGRIQDAYSTPHGPGTSYF